MNGFNRFTARLGLGTLVVATCVCIALGSAPAAAQSKKESKEAANWTMNNASTLVTAPSRFTSPRMQEGVGVGVGVGVSVGVAVAVGVGVSVGVGVAVDVGVSVGVGVSTPAMQPAAPAEASASTLPEP